MASGEISGASVFAASSDMTSVPQSVRAQREIRSEAPDASDGGPGPGVWARGTRTLSGGLEVRCLLLLKNYLLDL